MLEHTEPAVLRSLMKAVSIDDAAAIEELEIELFPDNCFNKNTLRQEIEVGGGLVIYKSGLLVGYLLARRDHELLDITRVGVRRGHQNHGLGTAMLVDVLGKTTSPVVLTVRKENSRAIKLYMSMGFSIVAETGGSWIMLRSHRAHTK